MVTSRKWHHNKRFGRLGKISLRKNTMQQMSVTMANQKEHRKESKISITFPSKVIIKTARGIHLTIKNLQNGPKRWMLTKKDHINLNMSKTITTGIMLVIISQNTEKTRIISSIFRRPHKNQNTILNLNPNIIIKCSNIRIIVKSS